MNNCFHLIFANETKYEEPIYHFISFIRETWVMGFMHRMLPKSLLGEQEPSRACFWVCKPGRQSSNHAQLHTVTAITLTPVSNTCQWYSAINFSKARNKRPDLSSTDRAVFPPAYALFSAVATHAARRMRALVNLFQPL